MGNGDDKSKNNLQAAATLDFSFFSVTSNKPHERW